MIEDGDSTAQLSAISTQAGLFERYWQKRVVSHELYYQMQEGLKQLITKMVEQQTVQAIPDQWPGQVREALFSAGLIRHPPAPPGRLPEQERVEFSHHLLFDYIAELLFVRPRRDRLAIELASPDTWGLFLRPSLVLFHCYAWHHGRLAFWDTLIELERSSVSVLQKLPGYLVVAEEARHREDLQPLLAGNLRGDSDSPCWMHMLQGVSTAATFSSLPRLFNSGSGDWWVEFARDLVFTDNPQLVFIGQRHLFSAADALENLSAQARLFLNQAAGALVRFHWRQDASPSQIIWPAIDWVCRTIADNSSESFEIVRRIIAPEELRRAGYIQAHRVSHHIAYIWRVNPALAVEVYDAIFGYIETDRSSTPLGGSLIISMVSNRAQDYDLAQYALSEQFPPFLAAHPREATQTLIRVLGHYQEQKYPHEGLRSTQTFTWQDRECCLRSGYVSDYFWGEDVRLADKPLGMLYAWGGYLAALPEDRQADEKWETIADVLVAENTLAVVWKRLLIAAGNSPAFYAHRLWTILLNPSILTELEGAVHHCIKAFVPYLLDEQVERVESAILNITMQYHTDADAAVAERYLAYDKAKLLCQVPDERRSIATREFLAACDPRLLQPRRQEPTTTIFDETMTTEGWSAEEGVDVASPVHQGLLQISSFLEELSVETITDDGLAELLLRLRRVEEALENSRYETDSEIISILQKRLIRGFDKVACSQVTLDDQLANELFERFKAIIALPMQPPSLPSLEQFDLSQFWSPHPRFDATEGFACLAAKAHELSAEYKELLTQLAADPDPVVRYHLGRQIWSFLDKWPEFVWDTLEGWVAELPTRKGILGVLSGTLHSWWFWWLRNNDLNRADQLLVNLWVAARTRNAKMLCRACGSWLAALSFFKGEAWASEAISLAVDSIRNYLDELGGILNVAVDQLLPRAQREPCPVEQRQRAMDFLLRLLAVANQALEVYQVETESLPPSERPSEPPEWARQVAQFFHTVAVQFLHSAEELAKRLTTVQQDEKKIQLEVWWETVEPILEALLVMPHPMFTYDMVKGLGYFMDLDIQRGLHWLWKVTLAGVPAGLANESLAADTTVEILGRILAEHKVCLAAGSSLRSDFVQTLEAYLQVGWPKAVQLAVQLESVFR